MLIKIKLNTIKTGHILQTIHRILIIGGSGSGKTNALLNLIENQTKYGLTKERNFTKVILKNG